MNKKFSFITNKGEFLGCMSKELPGRLITRFVSAGPKNYCEEHTATDGSDLKTSVKIRSFKLTSRAEKKLNFDNILRLVIKKFGPK